MRRWRRAAARQRLGEVYEWFSEGMDTGDMQQAAALIKAWA